jgi:hypothetical protein
LIKELERKPEFMFTKGRSHPPKERNKKTTKVGNNQKGSSRESL